MTFEDIPSATSSPGSPGGLSPFAGRGGQTTGQSGRVAALVSRFRRRVNDEALTTPGTLPLFGSTSLPSADLQASLESRLRARMAGRGSPLYALKWKIWGTRLGPPICALRASAHRTTEPGCGGALPTPTAPVKTNGHQAGNNRYVTAIQKRFGGRINPAFTLWQMGFPLEWIRCAPEETRSSRRSRRSS